MTDYGIGDPIPPWNGVLTEEDLELPKGVQSYVVEFTDNPNPPIYEEEVRNFKVISKLGEFYIKGYCAELTYNGSIPTPEHTVAVDSDIIPIGTHLLINGNEYVAEDTRDDIKGNTIGIFCRTLEECKVVSECREEVYKVDD